jgi:hypothetical protein
LNRGGSPLCTELTGGRLKLQGVAVLDDIELDVRGLR